MYAKISLDTVWTISREEMCLLCSHLCCCNLENRQSNWSWLPGPQGGLSRKPLWGCWNRKMKGILLTIGGLKPPSLIKLLIKKFIFVIPHVLKSMCLNKNNINWHTFWNSRYVLFSTYLNVGGERDRMSLVKTRLATKKHRHLNFPEVWEGCHQAEKEKGHYKKNKAHQGKTYSVH